MKPEEVDAIYQYIDQYTNNGVLEIHANTLKQFIIEMCECDKCQADY